MQKNIAQIRVHKRRPISCSSNCWKKFAFSLLQFYDAAKEAKNLNSK